MASENTTLQISVLTRTYRALIASGTLVRAGLLTKIIAAQGVMEDGSEIIAVGDASGSQSAVVMYPKEVVLAAALTVYEETDPANPLGAGNATPPVVHFDFSTTQIES